MINFINKDMTLRKASLYQKRTEEGFIDTHCHCLPGLDDGPANITGSVVLCNKLIEDNITTVVATPHQLGRYTGQNSSQKIRDTVNRMNEVLENSGQLLKILPGAEVRLDERICRLLDEDKIMTLGDGKKYILLELPQDVFINIEPLFTELASMGINIVIAHVERITALKVKKVVLRRWTEKSVFLQVTASSLIGKFGRDIERTSWDLLFSGFVTLVASDAHDLGLRGSFMREAFKCIKRYIGEEIARKLCIENPSRVISGMDVEPVLSYDRLEAKF